MWLEYTNDMQFCHEPTCSYFVFARHQVMTVKTFVPWGKQVKYIRNIRTFSHAANCCSSVFSRITHTCQRHLTLAKVQYQRQNGAYSISYQYKASNPHWYHIKTKGDRGYTTPHSAIISLDVWIVLVIVSMANLMIRWLGKTAHPCIFAMIFRSKNGLNVPVLYCQWFK